MAVKASAHITLSIERDIDAYYRYYLLQSSTLAKPSKPTTKPPSSSWDDTEPTYTAGSTNSLYFVDLTVFTDGTWSYSDVSLSSSYEAAKEAYNKAVAASNTAGEAKDAVDNLEVGGRNLYLQSKTLENDNGYWLGLNNWTKSDEDYEGFAVYSRSSTWNGFAPVIDVKKGDVYTLSFYGKVTAGGTMISVHRNYALGNVTTGLKILGGNFSSGVAWVGAGDDRSEWRRYWATVEVTADDVQLQWRVEKTIDSGTISLCGFKLERGNKATDWTPAPEDVDEDIDNAQTAAGRAQSTANDAITRINAAELTIDTINACISSLVIGSKGESLMTQTEDGWRFNISTMQATLNTTSTTLNTLTDQVGSVQGTVSSLQTAVNDLGVLAEYVRITTYYNEETGNNEPCIELGESDSDFKVLITNTRILFMEGSNTPTYIKDNTLMTNNVEVKNELRQTYTNSSGTEVGHWIWSVRQNGNYGLIWKEV